MNGFIASCNERPPERCALYCLPNRRGPPFWGPDITYHRNLLVKAQLVINAGHRQLSARLSLSFREIAQVPERQVIRGS
jgi:hypothetical protein